MDTDRNIQVSKATLDEANKSIEAGDYDKAIELISGAYSLVRLLLEHVWELKRASMLPAKR